MEKSFDILIIKDSIYPKTLNLVKSGVNSRKSKTLFLVLETPGGQPEAGFRIMNLLNALYKDINIVIPDQAMSTGTLMALGGDVIYMFYSSCLGPLDLQIEHPSDGSWISTLDVRDTMRTILSHTELAAKRIYDQTYTKFGLGKAAAAKIANETAVKLIQPIVNKIDPYHLHKSFRSAEVGAKYGAELLKRRMMSKSPDLADYVSRYLANYYETHNYSITLDEVTNLLHLNAHDLANLSEWEIIEKHYNELSEGVKYISIDETDEQKPAAKKTK
jgi:ATP-dependent protease ClpP protease subunit